MFRKEKESVARKAIELLVAKTAVAVRREACDSCSPFIVSLLHPQTANSRSSQTTRSHTSARRAICCVTETSSYTRATPFERQLVQKTASCSPSFRSMPVIQIGSIASCARESSFATVSPQLKSLSLTSALDVRRVVETVSQIVLSEEAEYSAETHRCDAHFALSSLFLRHASLQQKFVLNAARLFFADIGAVDAKSRQVQHLKRALVVSRTPELVSCSHAKETKHQTGEAVASVLILTRRPLLTHLSVGVHSAVPLPMPAPTVSYAVASDVLKSMSVGTMTSAPLLEKESEFVVLPCNAVRASERHVTHVVRVVVVTAFHVWNREQQYSQMSSAREVREVIAVNQTGAWEAGCLFVTGPVYLQTTNTRSPKTKLLQAVSSSLPVLSSSDRNNPCRRSAVSSADELSVKCMVSDLKCSLEACVSFEKQLQRKHTVTPAIHQTVCRRPRTATTLPLNAVSETKIIIQKAKVAFTTHIVSHVTEIKSAIREATSDRKLQLHSTTRLKVFETVYTAFCYTMESLAKEFSFPAIVLELKVPVVMLMIRKAVEVDSVTSLERETTFYAQPEQKKALVIVEQRALRHVSMSISSSLLSSDVIPIFMKTSIADSFFTISAVRCITITRKIPLERESAVFVVETPLLQSVRRSISVLQPKKAAILNLLFELSTSCKRMAIVQSKAALIVPSCHPIVDQYIAAVQTGGTHEVRSPDVRSASAAFCLNHQSVVSSVSMVQLDRESGFQSIHWNECRGLLRDVSHMIRATEITRLTIWEKEDALPAAQTMTLNQSVVAVFVTFESVAMSASLYQVQPSAVTCSSPAFFFNHQSVVSSVSKVQLEKESYFFFIIPQLKHVSVTRILNVRKVARKVVLIVLSREAEYSAETHRRYARISVTSSSLKHASLKQTVVLNAARLFFADFGAVQAKTRQVQYNKKALVVSRTPELASCSHAVISAGKPTPSVAEKSPVQESAKYQVRCILHGIVTSDDSLSLHTQIHETKCASSLTIKTDRKADSDVYAVELENRSRSANLELESEIQS